MGAPLVLRNHVIGTESFALVVQTEHGPITAITAVHQQKFIRRIGGIRFVTAGGLTEVGHLASCMTKKRSLADIPADGQKTIITCPDGIPDSNEAKAKIIVEHIRAVIAVDSGCIFGPDMNVSEAVLDIVAADPDLLDHVTGLSEDFGGLSIDKNGHTAFGIAQSISFLCDRIGLTTRRITIQGFGAVGAHLGRALDTPNSHLVAVSTINGVLIATQGTTLPGRVLFDYWSKFGDDALAEYHESLPADSGIEFHDDPDLLFTVPTDIFIPAARTSVLATPAELPTVREENSSVRDVCQFLSQTGVRVVAEAANHPLTPLAEEYLESHGVGILPDYVINGGGLIACYIEWGSRDDLMRDGQRSRLIKTQAKQRISTIIEQQMKSLSDEPNNIRSNARTAALTHSDFLEKRYGVLSATNGHQTAAYWLSEHLQPTQP
jgi:glutamate dehydrogenase (NAD(P)+)